MEKSVILVHDAFPLIFVRSAFPIKLCRQEYRMAECKLQLYMQLYYVFSYVEFKHSEIYLQMFICLLTKENWDHSLICLDEDIILILKYKSKKMKLNLLMLCFKIGGVFLVPDSLLLYI